MEENPDAGSRRWGDWERGRKENSQPGTRNKKIRID